MSVSMKPESDFVQAMAHLRQFLDKNDAGVGRVTMTLAFQDRSDLERFKYGMKADSFPPGYRLSHGEAFQPPLICGIGIAVEGYDAPPNPFAY